MLESADIALVVMCVLMSFLFTLIRTENGAPFYSIDAAIRDDLRCSYLTIEQIPYGHAWCVRMIGLPCLVRNWSGVTALMLAGVYGFSAKRGPSPICTVLLVLMSVAILALFASILVLLYTMLRFLLPLQVKGLSSWVQRSKADFLDLRVKFQATFTQIVTRVLRK